LREFEPMKFEPGDEFERELQQAFARRPAPPSLKRRLMEKRRLPQERWPFLTWQRLAASIALTAVLAGGVEWRIITERRREEAARRQVLMALRITGHALNQMNARLAAHSRGAQD
jgi:hypothetical protein